MNFHSSYLTAQATKIFGQEDSTRQIQAKKRGALAEIRIARAQHLQTIWHLSVNGSRRLLRSLRWPLTADA
jgi:hypothetical protein